jgi:hypothetical protein
VAVGSLPIEGGNVSEEAYAKRVARATRSNAAKAHARNHKMLEDVHRMAVLVKVLTAREGRIRITSRDLENAIEDHRELCVIRDDARGELVLELREGGRHHSAEPETPAEPAQ